MAMGQGILRDVVSNVASVSFLFLFASHSCIFFHFLRISLSLSYHLAKPKVQLIPGRRSRDRGYAVSSFFVYTPHMVRHVSLFSRCNYFRSCGTGSAAVAVTGVAVVTVKHNVALGDGSTCDRQATLSHRLTHRRPDCHQYQVISLSLWYAHTHASCRHFCRRVRTFRSSLWCLQNRFGCRGKTHGATELLWEQHEWERCREKKSEKE